MTQDFNTLGLAASMFIGAWTTTGATSGELMFNGDQLNNSTVIYFSKLTEFGVPLSCFDQAIQGDNFVISVSNDAARFGSFTIGTFTQLGNYVAATVEGAVQSSYFKVGDRVTVTLIKRGDPGLMTDAILTDGTDVLIDADGNVLSS